MFNCIDLNILYSTAYFWLNLSSNNAATIPTTIQTILMTQLATDAVKLPNGIIIMVAAITIPTIAWKATE